MNCARDILIATGITGGHFFPALSFADKYRERHPGAQITFLLSRHRTSFDQAVLLREYQFKVIELDPPSRYFSKDFLLVLFRTFKGTIQTLLYVFKKKPSALVSFGSYGSFPSVVSAWIFRIPIVVHEQNSVFGFANQSSGLFAKKVGVSFQKTIGRVSPKKIVYVGYPLRESLRELSDKVSEKDRSFDLLVLGGSQGSSVLNNVVLEFVSLLSGEEKEKIAVIHITGQEQFESVRRRYRIIGVKNEVYGFASDMARFYRRADLVIARAGAGTIFELAAFGLPSILVPYRFAYGHQSINARYLQERGAAVVIAEEVVTGASLKKIVFKLVNDEDVRDQLKRRIREMDVKDACDRLFHLVTQVQKRGKNS